MLTGWKCYLWTVSVYFIYQNIMQKVDLMEFNFEGLEIQKLNNRQWIELKE